MPSLLTRRHVIAGIAGAAGLAGTAGVVAVAANRNTPKLVDPHAEAIHRAEMARQRPGAATVRATLTPRPVTLDLGGVMVDTWGYTEDAPAPLIRAKAGDRLRVDVVNELPVDTSVHWHGIALRNDMDGVPGVTQDPIGAGGRFTYDFTAPHPGTYFYHPHSGVQLDRALHGVLIVDDPNDAGRYDQEWIVVLDDWVDGTGRTPDDVLAALGDGTDGMHGGHDMPGVDHGAGMPMDGGSMETMTSPLLGGAGDVDYPHYLINGRVPATPVTLTARPRQRVRIRLVNAASDTAFRVALGEHQLTVTHSDGFPVVPDVTDALVVGMGERVDVEVVVADGVFPLVAVAEGKTGQALAVVRTGGGRAPSAEVRATELDRRVILTNQLRAADNVRLPQREPDRTHDLVLGGGMEPYRWTINGKTFTDAEPLLAGEGERVRLRMINQTMMFHPMHVHRHTFALGDGGARKDTVIVTPHQTVTVDLEADNPGQWMTHCHNIYHAETGMMINLAYQL